MFDKTNLQFSKNFQKIFLIYVILTTSSGIVFILIFGEGFKDENGYPRTKKVNEFNDFMRNCESNFLSSAKGILAFVFDQEGN